MVAEKAAKNFRGPFFVAPCSNWETLCFCFVISAKCERSEHWRRLWDWLFCPCFCHSMYM